MATPVPLWLARIRRSVIAQRIILSFFALHVAVSLVVITVIPLTSGVPLRYLVVILAPLWCLGVVAWVMLFRGYRRWLSASNHAT